MNALLIILNKFALILFKNIHIKTSLIDVFIVILSFLLFYLSGKYLYVPEKNGECLRRVVTDEEEKTAILNEVHAGHFGIKRMMGKINQRFYWKGIVKDVEQWVLFYFLKTSFFCFLSLFHS